MFLGLLLSFLNFFAVGALNDVLLGQSVLYGISDLAAEFGNVSLCHRQLAGLLQGIEDKRFWALKALDASGAPGPGFFYGNNLWLGSHQQCGDISNTRRLQVSYKTVKHPLETPHDFPPYPMGFFVAHMEHNSTAQHHTQQPLEFTIQLGLCAPKSCTSEDLTHLIEDYLNNNNFSIQKLYDLDLKLTRIRSLEDGIMWFLQLPKTIALLCIFAIIIALTIIGTFYDVKKHNRAKNMITGHRGNTISKESLGNVSEVELVSNSSTETTTSTFSDVIKSFSVYSNVKNLLKTDLPPDSVPIIHGLKFFAMLWVIMVHGVFYQGDYMENVPFAYRLSEDIFAQVLSNSTYCVDTFLFLSGFLVSYLFFKSRRNSKPAVHFTRKISEFFVMFINRFLRLTPTYLIVIIFTDVMFTYYRRTSSLFSSEMNDILCEKYWWRNFLYINNLYPRSEMCMSWSWYLSVDTQFFAVSTFLLILSTMWFKTSAIITLLLLIGSTLATVYRSYSIGYIPTMDEQLGKLDAIYDLPWNRIGPYLVGVITAYVLVVKLEKKLVLKTRTRILMWILFPLLNLWVLFTLYTRNLSVEFSAVYMGVSRTLWGVGIGWIVIACCTGNARALEKFLSFKGWIPLSRLTYCAYLLNPVFANMLYMGSERALNASLASFAITIQGLTMSTYFVAFIFCLLVESPSILLTKMFFNRCIMPKPKEEHKTNP